MTVATGVWLAGLCMIIGVVGYAAGGWPWTIFLDGFALFGLGLWIDLTE